MAPPAATRNFQQHQPITTALRQICESYPAGTCLRELLQNADDAEATEIEYVLDTKTYADGPLLYEGLQQFQGPALLARNNKTFSDKDFASLSSIGDSRKRHDLAATGKFGQGFNSCYHWTDGPWIYSREWLLLLDPHESWSIPTGQAGGPAWDVVSEKDSVELRNHLKTFDAFSHDFSEPLDGTIIRIPLRTKAQAAQSKIVQREVTVLDIKNALTVLGREVRDGGLLFLKHVRRMVVRVDNEIMWEAQIEERHRNHESIRNELTADFKALFLPTQLTNGPTEVSKSFILDMSFKEEEKTIESPYLVHHVMQKSSGNDELDAWARSKKLFPWVAVGAPLKESTADEPFNGRLFSILRLPLETSQPVHIHGLFSITPDRGRLSSSGQTPGYEDLEVKWNNFMFEHCVAEAWAALLQARNTESWNEEGFSLWPRLEESPTDIWTKLDDFLLRKILSKDLQVWNTAHNCVSSSKGFFASGDGEVGTTYAEALQSVSLPAVYLKPSLLRKAQVLAEQIKAPFRLLSPNTVRFFLRANTSAISDNVSPLVLEYCILDATKDSPTNHVRQAVYKELEPIPLWPTIDGTLKELAHGSLILPRDAEELILFRLSRPEVTINLGALTNVVRLRMEEEAILGTIAAVKLRKMADLAVDWPFVYNGGDGQLSNTQSSKRRSMEHDEQFKRVWTWIASRFKTEKELSPELSDLWLLPIKGGHVRRCMSAEECRLMLIVLNTEPLYSLMEFDASPSQEQAVDAQILECQLMPSEAVKLLRKQATRIPRLQAASTDDLESLLRWFTANIALVSGISVSSKDELLREVANLVQVTWPSVTAPISDHTVTVIAQLLKHLPLFSRQTAEAPYMTWATQRSDLLADVFAVELPKNLPPLCPIRNLGFYSPSSSSESFLANTFKLNEDVPLAQLIFSHILPQVFDPQAMVPEAMKATLANYTFSKSRKPSDTWVTEINRFAVVPLQRLKPDDPQQYCPLKALVDPTTELAKLHFDTEDVFPDRQFFAQHQRALVACGLPREITCDRVLERARLYSSHDNLEPEYLQELLIKVQRLLTMSLNVSAPSFQSRVNEVTNLSWLPARKYREAPLTLLPPSQCRGLEESDLVDCVLGVVDSKVARPWRRLFGWDKPIDKQVLVLQLETCLKERRHDQANKVLKYITKEYGCDLLRSMQCILSNKRKYVFSRQAFVPGSLLERFPLSPHLEEIDEHFAEIHSGLIRSLGIRLQPSMDDILGVQDAIFASTEGLLHDDIKLHIIINSLEIASSLPQDVGITRCRAPNTQRRLVVLPDLVYGDRSLGVSTAQLDFVHPAVSADLVDRLGIESARSRIIRLQIEIDNQDDEEYVPSERLTTIIEDTLRRYPILSTFSEFLSNAEDCHASEISWILDRCENGPYSTESLLDPELSALQGPSLYAYNDKTFTAQDFKGFKDIGRGGKLEDASSIGLFGRGSMSMYHFTDNPMILSDKWLLILDPYEQVLPLKPYGYGKRKAGVKMSLETVRRLCIDQLKPFDGLCDFTLETEVYEGTLFRMPLKRASSINGAMGVRNVDMILHEYYSVARESLLFLNHVCSISYHVRDQTKSGWSIIAKHPEGADEEIFQQIKITGSQKGEQTFAETWRIGLNDVSQVPAGVSSPVVSKLKVIDCGIAACLSYQAAQGTSSGVPREGRRFYNKLPTTYITGIPVALHASFAVTGDRRTIATEDERDPNSTWNRWLLDTCIPEFYIEFLKDLAPKVGQSSFNFWPTKHTSGIAAIVQNSFWEKAFSANYEDYPLYPILDALPLPSRSKTLQSRRSGPRRLHNVTSMGLAEFDFLPRKVSSALETLLASVCPRLVRPPAGFKTRFPENPKASIKTLSPPYLSTLFKDQDNCKALGEFLDGLPGTNKLSKIEVMEMLLLEIVPRVLGEDKSPLHMLDGSRVLPLRDGSLGCLRLNTRGNNLRTEDGILVPTEEELELFGYAAEHFVDTDLFAHSVQEEQETRSKSQSYRDVIEELRNSAFNIRAVLLHDIGRLIKHPKSPLSNSPTSSAIEDWFTRLWAYLNARLEKYQQTQQNAEAAVELFLTETALQDCRVFRIRSIFGWVYLTLAELKAQPFVIEPDDAGHARLCSEIAGLKVIERRHVPSFWAVAECTLKNASAVTRLFRAFQTINSPSRISVAELLRTNLSTDSIIVLRTIVLESVYHDNPLQENKVVRDILIWPRNIETSSTALEPFLAAKDAIFCIHADLLMPWTKKLSSFVKPEFVRKNEHALARLSLQSPSAGTIWKGYVETFLPKELPYELFSRYHRMIVCLINQKIHSSAKIAPNGSGLLCHAGSLYDHNEELFSAAFRDPQQRRIKFVHHEFQDLRAYWTKVGLRTRRGDIISADDYIACIEAIEVRSNQKPMDLDFSNDAEKIAGYLTYDKHCFRNWGHHQWTQIAKVRMFTVQLGFTRDGTYRQARVRALAQASTHCSLQQAGMKKLRRVLWSQLPSLSNPPADYVYSQLPECSNPDALIVYRHLTYLMKIRTEVVIGDVVEFLKDVRACYNFLQNDVHQISKILGIRKAEIWLNLDTTEIESVVPEQLMTAVTAADRLCMNTVAEPYPFKNTLKFLTPYEKLLKALGVRALVVSSIDMHDESENTETPADYIAKSYRLLRDHGELLDVVFEAEGKTISAHKLTMASVSSYCKAQFSGEWGSILAQSPENKISLDLKYSTLSRMIDFAYDGTIAWTPLPPKRTDDQIADRLDELLDLLQGSDMWIMEGLHKTTEQHLLKNFHDYVRVDNVVQVQKEAQKARAKKVENACQKMIDNNQEWVNSFMDDSEEGDSESESDSESGSNSNSNSGGSAEEVENQRKIPNLGERDCEKALS